MSIILFSDMFILPGTTKHLKEPDSIFWENGFTGASIWFTIPKKTLWSGAAGIIKI
jgi:hypothetical protein